MGVEVGRRKRKQHRFDGFGVALGLPCMTHGQACSGTLRVVQSARHDRLKKLLQGGGLREGPTLRCGAKQAIPSAEHCEHA